MKPVVFLGPSLPLDEARQFLDAVYLPPAAQGDLMTALRSNPELVVIIDGHFEGVPAIWHNEILAALERGVTVIGAASMGALRAAELARYGMIGVGAIYRAYHRGWLEDDDEVAVVHAPAELESLALSEAMVNVRATCRAARRAGVLSSEQADGVVRAAKEMHFKERDWELLLSEARRLLPTAVVETLSAWLKSNCVDQKQIDARAALRQARRYQEIGPPPRKGERISVEPTAAWLRLLETTGQD